MPATNYEPHNVSQEKRNAAFAMINHNLRSFILDSFLKFDCAAPQVRVRCVDANLGGGALSLAGSFSIPAGTPHIPSVAMCGPFRSTIHHGTTKVNVSTCVALNLDLVEKSAGSLVVIPESLFLPAGCPRFASVLWTLTWAEEHSPLDRSLPGVPYGMYRNGKPRSARGSFARP